MRVEIRECRRCKHPVIPGHIYLAVRWLRERARRMAGRGLCSPCYDQLRRANATYDYARSSIARDDMLDDYRLLRDQGHTARQIADRLAIPVNTLKRALIRAHNDGDPCATHRPGGGW